MASIQETSIIAPATLGLLRSLLTNIILENLTKENPNQKRKRFGIINQKNGKVQQALK